MDGPRSIQNEKIEYLAILLHGYGADGNDLFSLVPYLENKIKNCLFVAPNAPFKCDLSPAGRQWFGINDIDFSYNFKKDSDSYIELKKSSKKLIEFIEKEKKKYLIKNSKVILIGFSQGTMMALHVGLQIKPELGCIIGFSGALIQTEGSDFNSISQVPVFLAHGKSDNIVNFNETIKAFKKLSEINNNVEHYIEDNLSHSIGNEGIVNAVSFINTCIKKKI